MKRGKDAALGQFRSPSVSRKICIHLDKNHVRLLLTAERCTYLNDDDAPCLPTTCCQLCCTFTSTLWTGEKTKRMRRTQTTCQSIFIAPKKVFRCFYVRKYSNFRRRSVLVALSSFDRRRHRRIKLVWPLLLQPHWTHFIICSPYFQR